MNERELIASQPQPFLPRYEVISPLGEGGVGMVYMVRDTVEGSVKALKALKHAKGQSVRNVERFEEEYRILRSLHHPSLPEVFDYGITQEETRYIVMEFVEGQALDEYVASHPEDLWLLLFQLSEALAFIHEHGLLHLDLKPKNLLVRKTTAYSSGEMPLITLLDFGVSQRRDAGGKSAIVGTPGYIAPEIIRGEDQLTRAVDYYSLGVTLYELLEGDLPFQGTMEDVLRAHLTKTIAFTSEKAEYVDLYPRVKKLMDKDPRVRLEAFDDFHGSVALKVGEELSVLEQAYGMGYLDSLGIIGKKELWDRILAWVGSMSSQLDSRRSEPANTETSILEMLREELPAAPGKEGGRPAGAGAPPDAAVQKRSTTFSGADLFQKTTAKLDREIGEGPEDGADSAAGEAGAPAPDPSPPRTMLISGAADSGKSFVLEALIAELKIRGIGVTVLSSDAEYEAIVSADGARTTASAVDPQSIIIDRFVRGWEHLVERAMPRGMVLIVDGYERLGKEVREFMGYLGRRLELKMDEGTESGLFVLVTGRNPQLKQDLQQALPSRKAEEIVIPPPGGPEIDHILTQFRAHMPGVEDRERLSQYLARGARSSGATIGQLKEALLRGDLERARGEWRFELSPTRAHARDHVGEDFYEILLQELIGKPREILNWLSCHQGRLYVDEFLEVSGLGESDVAAALERLKPYRVVARIKDRDGERLEIVSEAVRESFYQAIRQQDRNDLHQRYVAYFSKKPPDSTRFLTALVYHYEQLHEFRSALTMRIRALRRMRQATDIYRIRQSCADGIAFVRKLRGKGLDDHKWHLERYFIKQWVDAEWMLTNFKSLVDTVKVHIIARNREIPLSMCYKYATALERTGELKACRELITAAKKRIDNMASETYVLVSLVDASILYVTGAYDASIKVLNRVESDKSVIDSSALARVYILYMLNYENLGVKDKYEKYMKLGEEIAAKRGQFEHLLTVSFTKVQSFINSSKYEKAKQTLRFSIRTAHKHRVYRRLCSMYFLASAVYYEEGHYKSAVKFLDKAIRVALNMGMSELVNDYMLRYALIYQNLGYYGHAIRMAETVKNQVSNEYRAEQYFFALLILFDLHNSISHDSAESYKSELDNLVGRVEAKYRLALYHLLSGDFHYDRKEYDDAYQEYDLAYNMYEAIEYDDDAARCLMRMANILIDEGEYDRASLLIEKTKPKIKKMESEDLSAEFYMTNLMFYYKLGDRPKEFVHFLERCEVIWPHVSDINVKVKMNALLFRSNVARGELEIASAYFNQYYMHVKQITTNLPNSDYVNQFVLSDEFRSLVKEFKTLSKQHPNQPIQ